MIEDIVESLYELFRYIKDCTLLVLKHPHSANAVSDVLSKEFPENAPNIRDSHESLLKLYLNCDKVLLASKQTSGREMILIMA
jgi:hypothetical protein